MRRSGYQENNRSKLWRSQDDVGRERKPRKRIVTLRSLTRLNFSPGSCFRWSLSFLISPTGFTMLALWSKNPKIRFTLWHKLARCKRLQNSKNNLKEARNGFQLSACARKPHTHYLKAWPNARNISTQHLATLLHDVATYVERAGQTHATFSTFWMQHVNVSVPLILGAQQMDLARMRSSYNVVRTRPNE